MRGCTAMHSCFSFQFYIKPQLRRTCSSRRPSCFSFQFYIKPQLAVIRRFSGLGCFSFQFYIKPQPMAALDCAENMLFLIPILHQTTTLVMMAVLQMALFLIPILHQTTTVTSIYLLSLVLFLIPILHQTTTRRLRSGPPIGCFSFQFYIKPQPMQRLFKCFRVVSHSNSTSNHNIRFFDGRLFLLFLIPILHQTTTDNARVSGNARLFLIPILHQTTTSRMAVIHILHVTHMTPMHKTSCRTPGKLVGCNFVFQRAVYQKNSSC